MKNKQINISVMSIEVDPIDDYHGYYSFKYIIVEDGVEVARDYFESDYEGSTREEFINYLNTDAYHLALRHYYGN